VTAGTAADQGPAFKRTQTRNISISSPQKSPSKALKVIPESQLAKHKVSDIMAFVKTGNLPMVTGLVNYHRLGRGVVLVRGATDEFKLNGEKVIMTAWNPLLVGIANKKLDVVKYFLEDLSIALSLFGVNPAETKSDPTFALHIALSN